MSGTLLQDVRYAVRTLRRSPGFVVTALIVLAIGIGANTAVFTMTHSILLEPLPYPEPDRLVVVWGTDRSRGSDQGSVSHPDFLDWRDQKQVFDVLAASFPWKRALTGAGWEPERATGAAVSTDFFSMLGVRPLLGRAFLPADGQPGGEKVTIIGYGFWRSRFGGDRDVLGRTISLNDEAYRIVGVMPPSFLSPVNREEICWTPLQDRWVVENRRQRMLVIIGRLKPGVSIEQAQREMSALTARLEREYPEDNLGHGARVQDLREAAAGPVRPMLIILLAAVSLVLLVACMNLAHSLLARSMVRTREIAIRTALGAPRIRLIRQFLTESVLLSIGGGALGLLLSAWSIQGLKTLGSMKLPRMDEIDLDAVALVFTFGVSLLTSLLFGLGPALHLSRPDLHTALREGNSLTRSPFWRHLRALLVISQVAFATVLTIGACLLVQSFVRLSSIDPGFDPQRLLKVDVELPLTRYPYPEVYPDWPQVVNFYRQVIESVGSVSGVESVAISLSHPLEDGWTTSLIMEGRYTGGVGHSILARFRPVTAGYFRTIRQRLIRGRDFTDRDDLSAPPVVLINEAFVREYFPSEDPLGRRIILGEMSREIIGVVSDSKFMGLASPVEPAVYPPLMQMPASDLRVLVRTHHEPELLADRVRQAILKIDGSLPFSVIPMEQVLSDQVARPRFNMLLLSGFATLALILAITGVYGLILHTVSQQTREIGIRLALGARRMNILVLVARRSMLLVLWGLAGGLLLSVAITRSLSRLLFGISAYDGPTFGMVALALLLAGLIACSLPSLHATVIDPILALKPKHR